MESLPLLLETEDLKSFRVAASCVDSGTGGRDHSEDMMYSIQRLELMMNEEECQRGDWICCGCLAP